MLDLVSTRSDEDTARYANLLTAVIGLAVLDASMELTEEEKRKEKNLRSEVNEALKWLFEPYTLFEIYAALIGTDAQSIRDALLDKSISFVYDKHILFNNRRRRIFRIRYDWYQKTKAKL